jgi:hypothetical protein
LTRIPLFGLNPGDPREAIFPDDRVGEWFVATLAEAPRFA